MHIEKLYRTSYPRLWKQVDSLPDSVDIIGTMPSDDHVFLCIIGSRTHSAYGAEVCEKLVRGLAGYPIVIVSGLAIGIDSIAHESAMKAGLKTIAFPGSGLAPHAIYPASRRELAERIVRSGGTLISKFPEEAGAQNWMFPVRNMLMAALSHAVLVVEGRAGSGTLGTAGYAGDFNRDVLAVPGDIFSELSYGPHMLIRDGATAVTSSADILEAVGLSSSEGIANTSDRATTPAQQQSIRFESLSLPPDEQSIYRALVVANKNTHDLIESTSLSPSVFNIAISELEIKGIVRERDGIYSLAR